MMRSADNSANRHTMCPRCGYNLRGLDEPIACPECGIANPNSGDTIVKVGVNNRLRRNRMITILIYIFVFAFIISIVRTTIASDIGLVVIFSFILSFPIVVPLWFSLTLNTISNNLRALGLLATITSVPYIILICISIPPGVATDALGLYVVMVRLKFGIAWVLLASLITSYTLYIKYRTRNIDDI